MPNLDEAEFQFGPGSMWATLQQFMDGTTPGTPQPRKFDVMQSVDLTFDATLKSLMSNLTFPRAIGVSEGKVTIKVNFARFNGGLWQMRFGEPAGVTSGNKQMADDEAQTIPSVSTYTITVAKAPLFLLDYGVRYGDTDAPMSALQTGTPAQGEYVVNSTTGVYTFAAADAGRPVLISYEFTNTAVVWTDRGVAGTWSATHAYSANAIILDPTTNSIQIVTTAGTSGSSTPSFSATAGTTTTDGSVTWTSLGVPGGWKGATYYPLHTCISDSNGNIEQVTTAGITGGSVPVWPSSTGNTTTDGGGYTLSVLSHLQGQFTLTSLRYQGQYGGRYVGVYIPNAVGGNYNMPTKEGDFVVQSLEFQAFATPSGNVAYLYIPSA
jgi:hypothetical protein